MDTLFYQPRSAWQILKEGTTLYFRYIGCLTRPLLYPLFAQLLGVIFWIGLAYESVNLLTTQVPDINHWILWAVFLFANLPGMYLFLNGFWHYIVWVSGLNLLVRELVETGSLPDIFVYALRITTRPVDYSVLWTFFFAIFFVPVGFAVVPVAFAATHPEWYVVCMVAAVLTLFVGLLLACTLMIFFSLVFQVFAFTPGSAGASLFRSMDLVGQGIRKTLLIIVMAIAMTQFVLPSLITWVFDVTQLTQALSAVVMVGVMYVLDRASEDLVRLEIDFPYWASVLKMLLANPHFVAIELSRTLVYSFSSALLLPLGTCWFALLYADLKTRYDRKQLLVPVLEEAGSAVS